MCAGVSLVFRLGRAACFYVLYRMQPQLGSASGSQNVEDCSSVLLRRQVRSQCHPLALPRVGTQARCTAHRYLLDDTSQHEHRSDLSVDQHTWLQTLPCDVSGWLGRKVVKGPVAWRRDWRRNTPGTLSCFMLTQVVHAHPAQAAAQLICALTRTAGGERRRPWLQLTAAISRTMFCNL